MRTKGKLLIKSLLIIIFILGSTCLLFAQNPKQLYQKGLIKEEGEGLLQEAIDIYTKIVENSDAEKSLRANAQLNIGRCYEKKTKKKQATIAYEKILEQFFDQITIVAIAKTRLQRLNIQSTDKKLRTTNNPIINQLKIWDYIGKWDPEGKNYYFRGSYRGYWRLYKYNSASKETTQFSDITNTSLPYWSKDGKFMVLSKRNREFQLWMMKGVE